MLHVDDALSDEMLDDIAIVVAAKIDQAVKPLLERIAQLETELRDLPAPVAVDEAAIIERATKKMSGDVAELRRDVAGLAPIMEAAIARVDSETKASIEDIRVSVAGGCTKDELKTLNDFVAGVASDVAAMAKWMSAGDIEERVAAAVTTAVSALPPAEPGKSVTIEDVKPLLSDLVEKAVDTLPKPIGVAGAVIARDGTLTLTTSDGRHHNLGQVVAGGDQILEIARKAVAELPSPAPSKDADPEVVAKMVDDAVKAAISAMPVPEGRNEPDWESIKSIAADVASRHVAELAEMNAKQIEVAIRDAVAAIPPVEAPVVDYATIESTIAEKVRAAVSEIPPVEPKDVDIDELTAIVDRAVERRHEPAAAEIRKLFATVEEKLLPIDQQINDAVAAAISTLPAPVDGKDADPDLIRSMVREEVSKIPVPRDGKDIDPDVVATTIETKVAAAVAQAVEQLPAPTPGKDADPAVISAMVSEAFAALPVPRDGKDVDIEIVRGIIADEVAKIPAPRDGKDADIDLVKYFIAEAVAALPQPAAGKDADPELVRLVVLEEIAKLPPAIDGKDADPEVIREMVESAVARIPVPVNGKDADPEVIAAMVADAVAKIPAPKDGKSVTADDVAPLLSEMVSEAVAAIPVPKDGKSVTIDEIAPLVEASVSMAVAKIPAPKDGPSIEEVVPVIKEAVAKAVSEIPAPKDGKSVTLEEVRPVLESLVEKAAAQIRVPKDGVTLEEITPLVVETVERAVAKIPVPKDGVGLTNGTIDRHGRLILTLSDGTTKDLDVVVGKDVDMDAVRAAINDGIRAAVAEIPKPRDGFGFDNMDVVETERGVMLRFSSGDEVKEWRLPIPVYRGVFKDDVDYDVGDTVTYGGSMWTAREACRGAKPDGTNKAWRLSVKKGRDGQDAVVKEVKPKEPIRIGPAKDKK